MTLQLTPELETSLRQIAQEEHSTVDLVANRLIERSLTEYAELAESVRLAEQEADRDGWLSTDEVFGHLHTRTAKSA